MQPSTNLYDLADRLYSLAPWNWICEDQLIGLRHPETGELAHLSVMGQSGQHRCLAVYLGEEALHRFNLIHALEQEELPLSDDDLPSLILGARQLQVSFSVRADLSKEELAAIKREGRRYRGENWPTFHSYHPGRAPTSRLTEEETAWLAMAIGQLLEVAPLLREDPSADIRDGEQGVEILTRACTDGEWHTTWTRLDDRLYEFSTPAPSAFLVEKISRLPISGTVECLFLMIPNPIGKNQEEAYYPHLLMMVDAHSGHVMGGEMVTTESQTYEEMIHSIPDLLLRQCDKVGVRPSAFHVSNLTTYHLLEKTSRALGTTLELLPELPALDHAFDSLSSGL